MQPPIALAAYEPAGHTARAVDVGEIVDPLEADTVGLGVATGDTEGDAPVDGEALVGWALPPLHALGTEHNEHVPSVPAQ